MSPGRKRLPRCEAIDGKCVRDGAFFAPPHPLSPFRPGLPPRLPGPRSLWGVSSGVLERMKTRRDALAQETAWEALEGAEEAAERARERVGEAEAMAEASEEAALAAREEAEKALERARGAEEALEEAISQRDAMRGRVEEAQRRAEKVRRDGLAVTDGSECARIWGSRNTEGT